MHDAQLRHAHTKPAPQPIRRPASIPLPLLLISTLCIVAFNHSSISARITASWTASLTRPTPSDPHHNAVQDQELDPWHKASLASCRQLHVVPPPSPGPIKFTRSASDARPHDRDKSDRYERGTRPVLIKNATIWTGAHNGTEILENTDILLHNGLIQRVGALGAKSDEQNVYNLNDLDVTDAHGAFITPGLINVHSHAGVAPSPILSGAADVDSHNGIVHPWLRSLDGLNTHDEAYALGVAGGVSTALVLPGSESAIGGQAFMIKLRKTAGRTPSSMLVEPPFDVIDHPDGGNTPLDLDHGDEPKPMRWRHIKHAVGENPSEFYNGTRMDTIWALRQAYTTALSLKKQQDAYCQTLSQSIDSGETVGWDALGPFPEDLQWEALVDVLRGRVKVHTHAYEAVDLDAFVRLSQEFKFPIAAFHHASEAYLVPDLLKQAYGKPPAVAIYATVARYKREAYRTSEYAPRILAENNITVVMKTDDPSLNIRYLLHEAQLAHYYGLAPNLALASVTTNAADLLGLGHHIGYIREGYDADLVIWDSHPLALGATPKQVFIDGIPQFEFPATVQKPHKSQSVPNVPNFDAEVKATLEHDGLPPLSPQESLPLDTMIVFENVKAVYVVRDGSVVELSANPASDKRHVVVAVNGSISCFGSADCSPLLDSTDSKNHNVVTIDLEGGTIMPGLVSYGCPLGQEHIATEESTNSGNLFSPVVGESPAAFGKMPISYAVDGLQYESRNALLAYRAGITIGVTPPMLPGFMTGLGTAFSLGAPHKLATGAIVQDVTVVHVTLSMSSKHSVSTQITVLRRLLSVEVGGEVGVWFGKVQQGEIPLVVHVNNADIIATLLVLKKEIETTTNMAIRLTVSGAGEAHILAHELGEANVGVILSPARPFPHTWEDRRIIPGPPLTNGTALMKLVKNKVKVGLGCEGAMMASLARNLPFDLGWAVVESDGRISQKEAIEMGTTNMMQLLGVNIDDLDVDLIALRGGGLFDLKSKVVTVLSRRENVIRLL